MRKALLLTLAALLLAAATMLVVGLALPEHHVAAVTIDVPAEPAAVYALITDVAQAPAWRTGLERVELLAPAAGRLRWRETGEWGAIVMAADSIEPGRTFVSRIDDPEQPFGGQWTFRLREAATGTRLTITEEGDVRNPIFRFLSRFVFGHYGTLETYARDVARRFGGTAEPVRLVGGFAERPE